jgi:hypothetical protein
MRRGKRFRLETIDPDGVRVILYLNNFESLDFSRPYFLVDYRKRREHKHLWPH